MLRIRAFSSRGSSNLPVAGLSSGCRRRVCGCALGAVIEACSGRAPEASEAAPETSRRLAYFPFDAFPASCPCRWSEEEEDALRLGVKLYGEGKWKRILTDTDLAKYFVDRSNVDLKVNVR